MCSICLRSRISEGIIHIIIEDIITRAIIMITNYQVPLGKVIF